MKRGEHNNGVLKHLETSIQHHVAGVTFLVLASLIFFLSSSVSTQTIAYTIDKVNSTRIEDRPLRGVELSDGWLRDSKSDTSCLSLPEEIITKRIGFPFYYLRFVEYKPCGLPIFELNIFAFFVNSLIAFTIGGLASGIVATKTKIKKG